MLGADPKDLDVEIDNELVMPINKQNNRIKIISTQTPTTMNKTNETRKGKIVIHLILPGDQHAKPVSHLQQKLPQPQASSRVPQKVLDPLVEY